MYTVTIYNPGENIIIHHPDPHPNVPHLSKMNLTTAENKVHIFTFTINVLHPYYNKLTEFVAEIEVWDLKKLESKFYGRVLDIEENMDTNGTFYKIVTCESELSYLNDSRAGKWELHPSDVPSDAPVYAEPNYDTRKTIQKIIDNHNANVTEDKRFTLRDVAVNEGEYITTNYETSLDILLNKVISDKKVSISISREDGIRFIDILEENQAISDTKIELRKNLKSLKKKPDFTSFCTRLIALGADGITFDDINGGKTYVENQEAIAKYGMITKVCEWKNVTIKENLLQKATEKLEDILMEDNTSVEAGALDLFCIGLAPEDFVVGKRYQIQNEVMNYNNTLKLIQIDLDLLQPWNSNLTFSNQPITATLSSLGIQQQVNDNRVEVLTYNNRLIQKVSNVSGDFESYREQTDRAITERVTNNDFESYKEQTATSISERVSNTDFESYKLQTADNISQKVSKGEDFSSEVSQSVDAIKVGFNGISDRVEISNLGLQIKDGALIVVNSDGRKVFDVEADGYMFNEWGIAVRCKDGDEIHAGSGGVVGTNQEACLYRNFGAYHESTAGRPMYIMTNTHVEVKDLNADSFRDMSVQTLNANGDVWSNGYVSGASIINRSLRELKTNITKYDETKAYDGVKDLNIYNFNMNVKGENGQDIPTLNLGVIVDEAPIEITQLGGGEKADRKGINTYAFTSYLAAALKQAISKIEQLEDKINNLGGV